MNDKETTFDFVFKEQGGLFNYNSQELSTNLASFEKMADERILYVRSFYPNLPEISFGYINNWSLNASVKEYNGIYYIGLHIGTYMLLSDMFCKILSNKNVLSNLGNAEIETDQKNSIDAIIDNGAIAFDIQNAINNPNVIKPKDPTRTIYCSVFVGFVLEFLVFHEICHIIRGHLGYLNSLQNTMWTELDAYNKQNRFDPLFSQTLEMDADSFATNHVCIRTHHTLVNDNAAELTKDIFKNFESFSHYWTFAIYSFFRLCGFNDFDSEQSKKLSHPPPIVRVKMIMINIATKLLEMKYDQKEIDNIINSQLKSMRDAEEAFSLVTYADNDVHIFFTNYRKSNEYVEEIVNNWNNVYALINSFAYGTLPAMRETPFKFK